MTPRHLGEIFRLTRHRVSTGELVARVIPPSPALLIKLAEDHFAAKESARERLAVVDRAQALLDESHVDQLQFLRLRGKIRALQSRYGPAIADYRRAIRLQSHNIRLRFDLAQLLAAAGDRDEARRQAGICAYLAPRNQRYRALLESLHPTRSRAHSRHHP